MSKRANMSKKILILVLALIPGLSQAMEQQKRKRPLQRQAVSLQEDTKYLARKAARVQTDEVPKKYVESS